MFWFYFKRSQKNRSKIYGSYFELYNDFVNLSIENNKLFWYFLCFLIFYALFCVVFTFDLAFSALCFGFWHTLFWLLRLNGSAWAPTPTVFGVLPFVFVVVFVTGRRGSEATTR